MVTDQEPRYRLKDSNGNIVGTLFAESDGTLKLQEGTSGSENELALGTNGDVTIQSVTTNELVIGGTLYVEDDNSPIEVNGTTSTSYSLATDSPNVIIIPAKNGDTGFDQLQINGDTGGNYRYIDNADNQTTGQTEWSIPFTDRVTYLNIIVRDGVRSYLNIAHGDGQNTGVTVAGANSNVTNDISQFTLSDSAGLSRSIKARVYRRSIN